MRTVKSIIFVIGIFLINYVGGMPQDSRNLFITHTIFLAPLLVDCYPLLKIESFVKWIVRIIYVAGILILMANILGVAGIITVDPQSSNFIFSPDYYTIFELNTNIQTYLLSAGIVYASVFLATLTFSYKLNINLERESNKERKGMKKHVHT